MSSHQIKKSHKLDEVCYEIRGPVVAEAQKLEDEGYNILKLNTGNPAPFGLLAPDEIVHDVIRNLPQAQGYCESKGLFSARKAVMQDCQRKGIPDVDVEDVFIGNGVSELIQMSLQALLDNGDEVLIPAPDYPLWTACTFLAGGRAVHYTCDETAGWIPDLDDIRKKVTDKTKGIVIINPNNPTGAVYPKEILEGMIQIAREHNLVVFSDEIYDRILYDGLTHIPTASLADDLLFITFSGLSKVYRAAGFRTGWMTLSGNKLIAKDYIEGLTILATMRLCSNVPTQHAVQTALGGYQSIYELTSPGGRLLEQRDICYNMLNDIPGISCTKPLGALYCFPKIDMKKFGIKDDLRFALDLLREKKIMLVQGTGFNMPKPDHFRIVFLPERRTLEKAMGQIGSFLENYQQS